jgi:hypothetical protein
MEQLELQQNNLTGNIPAELSNLAYLDVLDLSDNHLSGTIPSQLRGTFVIDLARNQLSGNIPGQWGYVEEISLSHNQLSGEIPVGFMNTDPLWDLDIGYNMLTASDPALIAWLNIQDPDWDQTQTVPPADVQVVGGSIGESVASVQLAWTPIPYTGHGGFYEISYANTPGGPYTTFGGTTGDKTASGYLLEDLPVNAAYYFVVRTYTPAHGDQQNELWSDTSQEVLETITGVGSATITPEEGGTLMAATDTSAVTLSFPPGAVSEPVFVTFQLTPSPPAPSGLAFLGKAFAVEARTSAGAPVTTFSRPFTMSIEYDEANLAEGMDEARLELYFWNESTGEWQAVSSEVDAEADTLTARLDHLAVFGVLGRTKADILNYLPMILKDD